MEIRLKNSFDSHAYGSSATVPSLLPYRKYTQTPNTILQHPSLNITPRTIFGATKEDRVILFSGGIPAFVAAAITRVSPLSTSLMIPLNHVCGDDKVIMFQG